MEYFYQEPKSLRFKDIKEKHLSIALQGGGAKGILYTGVLKALREMKEPVKSLMCSSIGCFCGLAINCEVNSEAMISIIEQNVSLITEDLSYPEKDNSG